MDRRIVLAAVLAVALSAGCHTDPTRTEAGVLRAAFAAIRKQSWEDYAKLTVTTADFLLQEQKINVFKAKQSFAGGVLKPEEKERQKEQFLQASRGGPGRIDFQQAKFLAAGKVVDRGHLETLSGSEIPFKTYAVKVRTGRAEAEDLPPRFVVVPWRGGYRLLRLQFSGAAAGS